MNRSAIFLAFLAACSGNARSVAPMAAGKAFPFRIGALEAFALTDGTIDVTSDTFGVGRPAREVGDALASAGLPRAHTSLDIDPLLVKAGAHVLLFDTGAAGATWAHGGLLGKSLALAGVAPADVTDIFISHLHLDHTGGLITSTGALAFPNATVHMTAAEWTAMQAEPEVTRETAAIAAKVVPFEPGTQLLPEVKALATPGHTPGHSSYEITSNGERLVYLGDVAHHYVISVQHPTWTIAYDGDHVPAEAMRQQTLARLAADGARVYAVHFPFPGLGHIRSRGDAFAWDPEGGSR